MPSTTFAGPVVSGDVFNTYSVGTTTYNQNTGFAVLAQQVTMVAASATSVVATAWIPQQSQILGVFTNVATAWADGGNLEVGTPTNATAYLATASIAATGGSAFFALGTAAANVGTTQAVVFTATATAAVATGSVLVTLEYVQTTATYS